MYLLLIEQKFFQCTTNIYKLKLENVSYTFVYTTSYILVMSHALTFNVEIVETYIKNTLEVE